MGSYKQLTEEKRYHHRREPPAGDRHIDGTEIKAAADEEGEKEDGSVGGGGHRGIAGAIQTMGAYNYRRQRFRVCQP